MGDATRDDGEGDPDADHHAHPGAQEVRARREVVGHEVGVPRPTHETDESAFKSKGWLKQAATEKQLQYLPPEFRQDYGLTRYRASALMTFGFNKREIRQLVGRASPGIGRAA